MTVNHASLRFLRICRINKPISRVIRIFGGQPADFTPKCRKQAFRIALTRANHKPPPTQTRIYKGTRCYVTIQNFVNIATHKPKQIGVCRGRLAVVSRYENAPSMLVNHGGS